MVVRGPFLRLVTGRLTGLGVTKYTIPLTREMGVKALSPVPGATSSDQVIYIDGSPYLREVTKHPETCWDQSPPMLGRGEGDPREREELWERINRAREPYRLRVHSYRPDGRVVLVPAVAAGRAVCVHCKRANRQPASSSVVGRKRAVRPMVTCTLLDHTDRSGRRVCNMRRTYTVLASDFPLGLDAPPYGSAEHRQAYGKRALVEGAFGVMRREMGLDRNTVRTAHQARAALLLGVFLAAYNIRTVRSFAVRRGRQDPWSLMLGQDHEFVFTRTGAARYQEQPASLVA